MRLIWQKKTENFERWKKCLFSEEKTISAFKSPSLPNWEGAKYAGGGRPSC